MRHEFNIAKISDAGRRRERDRREKGRQWPIAKFDRQGSSVSGETVTALFFDIYWLRRGQATSVKTYSCCPSRITSTRLPARLPTTNSNPSLVGSIVINEIVPSSFFRDATVLFHSPKSNVVTPFWLDTASSPSSLLE